MLGFSNEEFRVPDVPIIAEIGLDVFEPIISDVSPEFFMSGARFFIDLIVEQALNSATGMHYISNTNIIPHCF